jgi:aminoglycoside 6-adenylyltransferase
MDGKGIPALLAEIERWASSRDDVRAALLVGSQARTETPADRWSDVDVVLFADDPGRYLDDAAWVTAFGTVLLTYTEPTPVGGVWERRATYADGLEIDFALVPAAAASQVAADPGIAQLLRRGHTLLYDELGLVSQLQTAESAPEPASRPAHDLSVEAWHQTIWAAKKLRRGEGWMARSAVEGPLKWTLLELARARAQGDTWHTARFAEQWAPETVQTLWRATARSPVELPAAIRLLADHLELLAGPRPELRGLLEQILPR